MTEDIISEQPDLSSHAAIQKLVGKIIIEVQQDKHKFLDTFFSLNDTPGAAPRPLAEIAIEVVTRIKTVELVVLTTLSEFMKSQGMPEGTAKFLHYLCKDITTSLFLLNELVSPETLLDVYELQDVEAPIATFNEQKNEAAVEGPLDLHQLSEDFKEHLDKVRKDKAQ